MPQLDSRQRFVHNNFGAFGGEAETYCPSDVGVGPGDHHRLVCKSRVHQGSDSSCKESSATTLAQLRTFRAISTIHTSHGCEPDTRTLNAIAPYATLLAGDGDISTGSRWHPNGVFAHLLATRADEMSSMARRTVLERQYAYPSEIGAGAVYLASDAAAFITGQILAIDGGTQIA